MFIKFIKFITKPFSCYVLGPCLAAFLVSSVGLGKLNEPAVKLIYVFTH